MLFKLKILLGITDNSKDTLLHVLLDCAVDEVKRYCRAEDVEELETLIVQMAVYKYNRIGTEGLQGENYSGAAYTYLNDYPEPIRAALADARRKRAVLKVY
ncbi:MAG TPA: phage head-tail connector protein [Candidatus Avimonoglobus intestinipullorum]|uniref:Phage head-tail connector protein n=1 Tax=Candidatus Avimonoglobus intestinipullorum TaxID=2840699 RepID=A0A9D1LUU7_9FIRM|nr:phage head-tail connector protein [Candidatus Avimonoglobus intestinipullorum]